MKETLLGFVVGLVLVGLIVLSFVGTSLDAKQNTGSITLSSSNTIVLNGEVSEESVGTVIMEARKLDFELGSYMGSGKPLYLFLNTPGGEVQSGLQLIEALNSLNHTVSTVSMFSASMGFQIVQGLNGERLVLNNSILMSHRASGAISGNFGGQKPSNFDNRYAFWYNLMQKMDRRTVSRTKGKQTLESYQKAYSDELWLNAEQSVDQGYADRVVTAKCDKTLVGVNTNHVNFLGFDIAYDLDKCPLNPNIMNVKVTSPNKDRHDKDSKDSKKASLETFEEKVSNNQKMEEVRVKFLEYYRSKYQQNFSYGFR